MDALEELEFRRPEIEALCREYSVKRLQTVGLTARGDFDLWTSDYQFLVEFDPAPKEDRHLELQAKLEQVLDGTVDLYDHTGFRSRLLRRRLDHGAMDWYTP